MDGGTGEVAENVGLDVFRDAGAVVQKGEDDAGTGGLAGDADDGGGVPETDGALAMGDEVNNVEGEFAGFGDALAVGDDLAFAEGEELAVFFLLAGFGGGIAPPVGVNDDDGAGGGMSEDGGFDRGRGGRNAGGDKGFDGGRGWGRRADDGRRGVAAEEQIGELAGGAAAIVKGGDGGQGGAPEEALILFEPGGGAAEFVPGGEGFGVRGTEAAEVTVLDLEGKVATHHPGFGEGDLEGFEGDHAGGGIAEAIAEEGSLGGLEGTLARDEVAVGIDPGFVAGAGDFAIGSAATASAADAGPEAAFDGFQGVDDCKARGFAGGFEVRLGSFEPDGVDLGRLEEGYVRSLALRPTDDQMFSGIGCHLLQC